MDEQKDDIGVASYLLRMPNDLLVHIMSKFISLYFFRHFHVDPRSNQRPR